MLSFFFAFSSSWGALFHQAIAKEYIHEHFPNISKSEENGFLLGAIYADGIMKDFSHHVKPIYEKFNFYLTHGGTSNTQEYWFYMGLFAHIIPDTFAHAGHRPSYIVPSGIKHMFSEILIDSLIRHYKSVEFLEIPEHLKRSLEMQGIQFTNHFPYLYKIDWFISHFPIWRLLQFIKSDQCSKENFQVALCDFQKHYQSMLSALQENIHRAFDPSWTDQQVRIATTAKVFSITCCPVNQINPILDQTEPYFQNSIQRDFNL